LTSGSRVGRPWLFSRYWLAYENPGAQTFDLEAKAIHLTSRNCPYLRWLSRLLGKRKGRTPQAVIYGHAGNQAHRAAGRPQNKGHPASQVGENVCEPASQARRRRNRKWSGPEPASAWRFMRGNGQGRADCARRHVVTRAHFGQATVASRFNTIRGVRLKWS